MSAVCHSAEPSQSVRCLLIKESQHTSEQENETVNDKDQHTSYRTANLNSQIATKRLGIVNEKRVDQTEKLHDTLILAQVLVPFEQEHVLLAIAAGDAQLPRPLF